MNSQRNKWKEIVTEKLKLRNIVIIQGLRRIGKTALARDILNIESFSEFKKIEFQVGLFGQDDFKVALDIFNEVTKNKDSKYFIFVDEFQDLTDWGKFFKSLYDLENVKVLASGSISAMVEGVSFTEGGRFEYVKMPPLSFEEYLFINNLSANEDILIHFDDYSTKGSYPGKDFKSELSEYKRLVSENIIEKIKNIETLNAFGLANPRNVDTTLLYIISTIGQTQSITSMSEKLNIDRITLEKVINYLKQTFIIYEVENTTQSKGRAAIGNRKYYLEDHSFYLFSHQVSFKELDPSYKGFLFENILLNQLRTHYDKYETIIRFERDNNTSADIDLVTVKNDIKKYFEIKYSSSTECLSKNQLEFSKANQLSVIYFGKTLIKDNIQFINFFEFIFETDKWI